MKAISAAEVKEIARMLGADLCGIASAERFTGAPEGYRPTDIFSGCKSVIVYAKRIPAASAYADSLVPYTQIKDISMLALDRLGIELSLALEDRGVLAVALPTDSPYEYFDTATAHGQGILSMRHAGYLAGLGILGKNTLLMTEAYGNMIHIGAVLANCELEQDPLSEFRGCPTNCNRCLKACPQQALDGVTADQQRCRAYAFYTTPRGFTLFRCNRCHTICPRSVGKQSPVRKALKEQQAGHRSSRRE